LRERHFDADTLDRSERGRHARPARPAGARPPNRKPSGTRITRASALRAGIIGLGAQGRSDHVPALVASRAVDLVAVCDTDTAAVETLQAELGVHGYTDFAAMFASTSARPDRAYDAEDTALVHFAYDTGLYGSLLLSRSIGPKTEQLRLAGTEGTVVLERGRLRRLDARGTVLESLTREHSWPAAATAQVDHFARVIAGTRPNPSGPAEHLAHLAFITACYTAARTGASVNPKELL
jgi:predicted dehydrogenase